MLAELEELYRILKDLGLQMEVEGYIPDIDEQESEPEPRPIGEKYGGFPLLL